MVLFHLKMQLLSFFFFQAEDGIRDSSVTGVQTCALPICRRRGPTAAGGTINPTLRGDSKNSGRARARPRVPRIAAAPAPARGRTRLVRLVVRWRFAAR